MQERKTGTKDARQHYATLIDAYNTGVSLIDKNNDKAIHAFNYILDELAKNNKLLMRDETSITDKYLIYIHYYLVELPMEAMNFELKDLAELKKHQEFYKKCMSEEHLTIAKRNALDYAKRGTVSEKREMQKVVPMVFNLEFELEYNMAWAYQFVVQNNLDKNKNPAYLVLANTHIANAEKITFPHGFNTEGYKNKILELKSMGCEIRADAILDSVGPKQDTTKVIVCLKQGLTLYQEALEKHKFCWVERHDGLQRSILNTLDELTDKLVNDNQVSEAMPYFEQMVKLYDTYFKTGVPLGAGEILAFFSAQYYSNNNPQLCQDFAKLVVNDASLRETYKERYALAQAVIDQQLQQSTSPKKRLLSEDGPKSTTTPGIQYFQTDGMYLPVKPQEKLDGPLLKKSFVPQ